MKFFNTLKKKVGKSDSTPNLLFASIPALERALDGTDEAFERYYFALYHCPPDENNQFNAFRDRVSKSHPNDTVSVGTRYVLWGEAAFEVVSHYYSSLAEVATPDEFRTYAKRRLNEIVRIYQISRNFPEPIDISEGQLSADKELEFFACLALGNKQIVLRK
jgi:hypothetical protein